jgi:hypothetical protein
MAKKNSKRQPNGAENKSASPALLAAVRNAKWNEQPTIPVGALKLREARAYLGNLSKPTMYRLVRRGLLKPNRSLRHLTFAVAELDRYIREASE